MAFPKKGTRKISVSGENFFWRIRKKVSHNERHDDEIGIPIQHESEGTILIANVGYCRSGYTKEPISRITPSIIEGCIKLAMEKGWNFKEKGQSFVLDCKSILES